MPNERAAAFTRWHRIFERLSIQYQRPVDETASKAYFEVLSEFPLEIVADAARQLAVTGTRRNWMPTAPEWAEVADRLMAEADEARLQALEDGTSQARQLTAGERRQLEAARDAAVEAAASGALVPSGVAAMLRELPVRGEPRYVCSRCQDRGVVLNAGSHVRDAASVVACACAETNPVVVERHAIKARMWRRHARELARA